jgi:hypothetical protein
MAKTGFYNDNANRRYPFISTSAIEQLNNPRIPNSVLLDAGFEFSAAAAFNVTTHAVTLSDITWDDETVQLVFVTDGATAPLIFNAARGTNQPTILRAVSGVSDVSEDPLEAGSCPDPEWSGFIVIQDIEAAVTWRTIVTDPIDGDTHTIEPALLTSYVGAYVRRVHVANQQRTRVSDDPAVPRPYIVQRACIDGPIQFIDGYNSRIDYDLRQNGVIFNAIQGGGAGEPCFEVPQFAGEQSPDSYGLLSGGPPCSATFKSVNGVPGPVVKLRGGLGVRVSRDPVIPNRLIVRLVPPIT